MYQCSMCGSDDPEHICPLGNFGPTLTTVVELKKDPTSNSEYVIASSEGGGWGRTKKITFLARRGTHKIGDPVQVTVAVEPKKEN